MAKACRHIQIGQPGMLRHNGSSFTFSPWLQCLQEEIAKCNSTADSNDPSHPPHTVCILGSAGTLQAGNIAILPAFTANSNVSSHARQEINLATEHLNNLPYQNWKMFLLLKPPIYNIFSKTTHHGIQSTCSLATSLCILSSA